MSINISSGGYQPSNVSNVSTQSSGAGEVKEPPAAAKPDNSDKVTLSSEALMMSRSSGAGEVKEPPLAP